MSSAIPTQDPKVQAGIVMLKKLAAVAKRDGWENIATGLGTSRDKRLGGRIVRAPATRTHSEVEAIYLGDHLAATMADRPANDMVRKWIALSVDQTPTDGDKARQTIGDGQDPAKLMQTFLRDIGVQAAFQEAELWAQVFGGSLIFMGFDDGATSLSEPLNENNLRSLNNLEVFDRFDVRISKYENNPRDPDKVGFGRPKEYEIMEHVLPGGVVVPNELRFVHASRMLRFDGVKTTRRRRRENMGWDDSIYEKRKDIIRDFNLAWGGIAHLLQDFAQFVIKIRGLADALAEDNDKLIIDRLMNMDFCRSTVRAIPLDAEMEDAERKVTPVNGLAALMDRFAIQYSAAAKIPVTLLFGSSPAGQNATGESDLINYYDQIGAAQEVKFRPKVTRLVDLTWKTAEGPTRGRVPASWSFAFNPLWALDDKEEAERRKTVMETDVGYMEQGVLDSDEVRDSRYGGDAYSIETVLQNREAVAPAPVPAPPIAGLPTFDYIDRDLPEFDDVEQWRWDQARATPAVCDKSSPSYDPGKCAASKQDHADQAEEMASRIQTLIFQKSRFPSAADARAWAADHDFSSDKIDETGLSFRLRQRDPGDFIRGSLRTITLTGGVQAVIGRPQ